MMKAGLGIGVFRVERRNKRLMRGFSANFLPISRWQDSSVLGHSKDPVHPTVTTASNTRRIFFMPLSSLRSMDAYIPSSTPCPEARFPSR